jgi:hypothetical protein
MEIILSKQCESLTGSLGRGFGYFIVGRWSGKDAKYRFYSQRSKHSVPPDGHWRFIVLCAELAQNRLHISDISVRGKEIKAAITEAGRFCPAYKDKEIFNAERVLTIKTNLGL